MFSACFQGLLLTSNTRIRRLFLHGSTACLPGASQTSLTPGAPPLPRHLKAAGTTEALGRCTAWEPRGGPPAAWRRRWPSRRPPPRPPPARSRARAGPGRARRRGRRRRRRRRLLAARGDVVHKLLVHVLAQVVAVVAGGAVCAVRAGVVRVAALQRLAKLLKSARCAGAQPLLRVCHSRRRHTDSRCTPPPQPLRSWYSGANTPRAIRACT